MRGKSKEEMKKVDLSNVGVFHVSGKFYCNIFTRSQWKMESSFSLVESFTLL